MLTNLTQDGTTQGSLTVYPLATGLLQPIGAALSTFPVSAGAVAEITYGPEVYVLSANAVAEGVPGILGGGYVDSFVPGNGSLTAGTTIAVTGPEPFAMTAVVAH